MGPEACSPRGEKFVMIVERKMAQRHRFFSVNKVMGAAISNITNKIYIHGKSGEI